VPSEELGAGVDLERRYADVPAQVGVQRLLRTAEGVKQVERAVPVIAFIVALQQYLERNRDLPGFAEYGAGQQAPGEEVGRADTRLDHREPDAGAGREPVRDRAARADRRSRCPQDAGDVAESEVSFEDVSLETLPEVKCMIVPFGSAAGGAPGRSTVRP
jgi:hypothetical protein